MDTDHLETQVHRSNPPLDKLLYTRNDELWHTKANDIAPKPAKIVGRKKTSLPDRSMSGISLQIDPAFIEGKQHSTGDTLSFKNFMGSEVNKLRLFDMDW